MSESSHNGKIRGRVTVMDVARAAELSYGVVADILRDNTRYRYRPETIARVQQTAQQLAYRPSRVARALTTGRTHQIALCLPLPGTSFSSQFIRAFDHLLHESSYDLLIASHQALKQREITVDGVLLYGASESIFGAASLPVVAITTQDARNNACSENCDTVFLNLHHASHAAMQHYLEQGCRRILFVSDRSMTQECEPRYAAYHTAMEAAALPIEILALELPREEHIREQAHRQLREYFAAHGFPDALFCSNDDIAAGAYRALREAGQRIPQQTAVLGCDDLEISQDLSPPLTSIHIPFEEIAQRAWGLLQQRLQNPQRPTQHAELKATLRVRKSSQRPSNRPASARRKIKRKEK